MITVTTFRWVPPFARGLVRDLRVRWALEEAGRPYATRLLDHQDRDDAAFRSQQPFGQVPVYQEDDLVLFESGAIVAHVAAGSETLLPAEPHARARTLCWLFAALNSVEVTIQPLADIDLFHADENWAQARRPAAEANVRGRLAELAAALGDRPYLEGGFTAADLMMTTVLRILRHTDLVAAEPVLADYQTRCEARPAFQRALADHMAVYDAAS